MSRWIRCCLPLTATLALAITPSDGVSQECGWCWFAANGPNYVHVFAVGTPPEPPSGYEMQDDRWKFLEAESGEAPSWAGHDWWLPGTCDVHSNCIPSELWALVEAGDHTGVVEWLMASHHVVVDASRPLVSVACFGEVATIELSPVAWMMYRAAKAAEEVLGVLD